MGVYHLLSGLKKKQMNVGLGQTDILIEKTDFELQQKNVGLEQTDILLEQTNIGLAQTDVLSKKTIVGLEQTEIQLEESDVGLEQTDILSEQTDVEFQQANIPSEQTDVGFEIDLRTIFKLGAFFFRCFGRGERKEEYFSMNIPFILTNWNFPANCRAGYFVATYS
jgi:hypothetical protein